ncbi:hypothetical protein [Xanthomonas arboricola]|uniref:hypothetical protein n=1 Tax=Xanthomonas arboricola TaxID=56448 RepID=UPI0011B0EC9D|nr:hypothetical protein [Xanthomonas arboricola]
MGINAIRHVGDDLLTTHITPCDKELLPELLLSKPGSITLHRYQPKSIAFADQRAAYAKRWMVTCHVSSTGSVSWR